jgi:hypothetical protein
MELPGGVNLEPAEPKAAAEPAAKAEAATAPPIETITREVCPHCSATASLIGGPKVCYRIVDVKGIHWCANCRHPGTLLDPAANEAKKAAARGRFKISA